VILSTYPLLPGVVVDVRIIGMVDMQDEKGRDAKILGVVAEDPRWDHIKHFSAVPEAIKAEIQNFFETYKALEAHKGKWVKVTGWQGPERAKPAARPAGAWPAASPEKCRTAPRALTRPVGARCAERSPAAGPARRSG